MPGIDAKSDAIYELVEEGSEVERVATGFTFTEGPIWHPTEHYLLFSDMPGDTRRKYTPGVGAEDVMSPSNKCNGLTYDADLDLLVCEHVTSSLVRERPDGTRETIASHFEGKELNSPNDVASTRAMRSSSPIRGTGACPSSARSASGELGFQGVYRLVPGGGEPELLVDPDAYEQPNGLCFSPDESLLYINDTPGAYIDVYDADAYGRPSNRRRFFSGSAAASSRRGSPTG